MPINPAPQETGVIDPTLTGDPSLPPFPPGRPQILELLRLQLCALAFYTVSLLRSCAACLHWPTLKSQSTPPPHPTGRSPTARSQWIGTPPQATSGACT